MQSKVIRLLLVALYLTAGVLVIRLWALSSSYSPSSTQFRRGYFLIDLLLGTGTSIQAMGLRATGSKRTSGLVLAPGILILLVGVRIAYSSISGRGIILSSARLRLS